LGRLKTAFVARNLEETEEEEEVDELEPPPAYLKKGAGAIPFRVLKIWT
jgi:hypothetical protein